MPQARTNVGLKPEVCQHGTVTAVNSGVRVLSEDRFMSGTGKCPV